jgi:hypothetical protein
VGLGLAFIFKPVYLEVLQLKLFHCDLFNMHFLFCGLNITEMKWEDVCGFCTTTTRGGELHDETKKKILRRLNWKRYLEMLSFSVVANNYYFLCTVGPKHHTLHSDALDYTEAFSEGVP